MLEEDRRHPTLAELPTHGNPSGASARRHTAVSSEHYKPKADVQELTAQHTPVHVEHLSACKTYSIPATGAHGSTLEASVPHAFRVQQSLSSGELSPSGFQEVDGSDSDGSNHICRRPLPKWTMIQAVADGMSSGSESGYSSSGYSSSDSGSNLPDSTGALGGTDP